MGSGYVEDNLKREKKKDKQKTPTCWKGSPFTYHLKKKNKKQTQNLKHIHKIKFDLIRLENISNCPIL